MKEGSPQVCSVEAAVSSRVLELSKALCLIDLLSPSMHLCCAAAENSSESEYIDLIINPGGLTPPPNNLLKKENVSKDEIIVEISFSYSLQSVRRNHRRAPWRS